jgi:serine/threonine-protein kinase
MSRSGHDPVRDSFSPLPQNRVTDSPRPVPVAEPEIPEGQVTLASKFYIERGVESDCYRVIERDGALIRIKAPRQMGKTSLMSRIIAHGREKKMRTVALSFQLADEGIFSSLDAFLEWFCSAVAWKLEINERFERAHALSGSKIRATSFFERSLLTADVRPLLVALDEVDLVFDHLTLATSFFSMLRAWHEEGKNSAIWNRLRLVIVHSTEAYIPLKINQSPFNVGFSVGLPEFTEEQVRELARRHGQALDQGQMREIMELLGGHPYLTRVVLYEVLRTGRTLQDVCANAATEAGILGDHLRRHFWNLSNNGGLALAMYRVVSSDEPVMLKSEEAFKLESMGLVHRVGAQVRPRCSLYRAYFKSALAGVM